MSLKRLHIFDVDGTLIRGFLNSEPCEVCHGEGRVHAPFSATFIRCENCKGKGQHFKDHLPYANIEILPRRREYIEQLAKQRSHFAIATNQGGVAMGYQSWLEVTQKMGAVVGALDFFFAMPLSVHIAIGHEHAKDHALRDPKLLRLRKPNGGMIEDAMRAHQAGASETIMVGDMPADRDAAEAAGVEFAWAKDFFDDCDHEWVSARGPGKDPVVQSGEICSKCHALR